MKSWIQRTLMGMLLSISALAFAQYKVENNWLIDFNSPDPGNAPAMELWVDVAKKKPTLWRLMSRGSKGILLVEMIEPILPKGHVYNYGECAYQGKARNDVIAQVKHGKAASSKEIAKIWLIDPAQKSFRQLPNSAGFECSNVGWGI